MAVLTPLVLTYDPETDSDLAAPQASDASHPFGTDALGRDILMRILHGARVSLGLGVSSVVLAAADRLAAGPAGGLCRPRHRPRA